MDVFDFAGMSVHCEVWGAGGALLMAHSGVGSGAQWQRVAAFLDGRRCVAPDLLGHGRTGAPAGVAITHDLQADLLAALIERGPAGPDPVDVVGHSYGGAGAVRLALRRPGLVRSLVLIEPLLMSLLGEAGDPLFAEYEAVARDFLRHAEAENAAAAWARFMDYRNGPGAWAALGEKARARLVAQTALGAETLRANLANPTTLVDCCRIAVPTTVVLGAETTPADRRTAEVLAATVPGSRCVAIPGAGHMSPLTHPEEVARIIRECPGKPSPPSPDEPEIRL
ncbi:alpha/beta hydrolase [Belnapia sp. T6]|uniref:Alpha/beta hydrolase n=1 Tax=Belnapia mucosa TaxID=2804532 RepID=A0ABS1VB34_9PROT|nr:alpha/beta hydrolase [Belnapia mucosa]MBL6458880.1 alpha/beta hydrolase [Belnapia mucosa]